MPNEKWKDEPEHAPGLVSNLACINCGKVVGAKTIEKLKCEHCGQSIKIKNYESKKIQN